MSGYSNDAIDGCLGIADIATPPPGLDYSGAGPEGRLSFQPPYALPKSPFSEKEKSSYLCNYGLLSAVVPVEHSLFFV